jgi:hypothetical protein
LKASDYSQEKNWLSLPDSIDKSVDVFYLYPTAWIRLPNEPFLCPIDHKGMRKGAETVFPVQASIFFPVGNVFAPFYRQLDGAFILNTPLEERRRFTADIPKADAQAAFVYYLKNFNKGRPFILAAHSQGALTMKELLFDFAGVKSEYDRMIAAYIIGYGVTEGELKQYTHLKFAQRSDDTGVIISYNTEQPGCVEPNPTAIPGSLAINPLLWTTEETHAPKELNIGSLISGKGKLAVKHFFADAAVNRFRGTLVCATVSVGEYGNPPPLGAFHSMDTGLYYKNLRENAGKRAKRYME